MFAPADAMPAAREAFGKEDVVTRHHRPQFVSSASFGSVLGLVTQAGLPGGVKLQSRSWGDGSIHGGGPTDEEISEGSPGHEAVREMVQSGGSGRWTSRKK